jgi:alginate O-acetyltransferase complex protein AlgI
MLFNSLQYALFLPVTWLLFWLTPTRWRVELLLVASYIFYASWSPPYAALMFVLAVANYLFGLAVGRATRRRRLVLGLCIAADLAVLGFFKYWNFAAESTAAAVHSTTGAAWEPPFLELLLPLGISFFTFEFIHYLVDIYRGSVPVHSFSKFHVFAAFFPTQIAGPIKRFQQFVPALGRLDRFDPELAKDGLRLIAIGLVKKVLLADKLAPIADAGFAAGAAGQIGSGEAWAASLAFALQIYFDFSGYTDIARGSAQLFGFHIPINFDAPYLASSVSDFWRRWHISLSSWLRDYLFIPLGGSRRGLWLTVRNLLITMTLGGLWHGAAWHFVVWGLYWGVALSIHRLARAWLPLRSSAATVLGGWIVTQLVVLVGWVLFRAETLAAAAPMLRAMLTYEPSSGAVSAGATLYVMAVATLLILASLIGRRGWWATLPTGLRPVFAGAALALIVAYAAIAEPPTPQRFIYFQF